MRHRHVEARDPIDPSANAMAIVRGGGSMRVIAGHAAIQYREAFEMNAHSTMAKIMLPSGSSEHKE